MENLNFPGNQNVEMRLEEIVSLLRAGKKINAIKVYREVTGASLAEAKGAVERIEQAIQLGGTLVNSTVQAEVRQMVGTADADSQSMLLAEIARLISQGQKIAAIKLYRQHTGMGLADAKNAVDRVEQTMRTQGW